MNRTIIFLMCSAVSVSCSKTPVTEAGRTASWGDQGNGTYINPILAADYSDPDVIRVDDTYYMVASDFHFMGMQVLKSKDMVNWEYLARIYDRLDAPRYDAFEGYGNGYWKGIRPALFSYNVLKDAGIACFDDFTMKFN